MIIGNYVIHKDGTKVCLKCCCRTLENRHRCWEPKGRYSGNYVETKAPEFVVTVAKIVYDNWLSSLDCRIDRDEFLRATSGKV
jgi:hypothetical protein